MAKEISPTPALTGRLAVYLILIAGLFQAMVVLTIRLGWEAALLDDGVVEWAQVGLLLLAGGGLAALAVGCAPRRGLYALLAFLCLFAACRELNYLELHRLYLASPVTKAILVGGALGALVAWHRKALLPEARALLRRRAMVFFLLGFVFVTLWAQVLGQQSMWNRIYEGRQAWAAKRFIEEGLELAGYFFICCGVLEELLQLPARAPALSVSREPEVPLRRAA